MLTKDQITQDALKKLRAGGARVRKVHNVGAYRKRQYQIEKGWPDIQGFSSQGQIVLCEVKTQNDVLSKEQINLLTDCHNCGGLSYIAYEINGTTYVESFCIGVLIATGLNLKPMQKAISGIKRN